MTAHLLIDALLLGIAFVVIYGAFWAGRWLGRLDRDEAVYTIRVTDSETREVLFDGSYNLAGLHETAIKFAGRLIACKIYLEEDELQDFEALQKALDVTRS